MCVRAAIVHVHSRHCVDMHSEEEKKYPVSLQLCWRCRLGLQRGADCWTAGMNGSRHLLSLVSQTRRGCTVQSEENRITNERDISAERHTEGAINKRTEDGGRQLEGGVQSGRKKKKKF